MLIGGLPLETFKEIAAEYGMTVNQSKPGDKNVVYDKSGRGYTREEILNIIFEPFKKKNDYNEECINENK